MTNRVFSSIHERPVPSFSRTDVACEVHPFSLEFIIISIALKHFLSESEIALVLLGAVWIFLCYWYIAGT